MGKVMPFGAVLEAVGKLSLEEQETLLNVLQRRIIEYRREELPTDIWQAQQIRVPGRPAPTRNAGGACERNPGVNHLLLRSRTFVRAARQAVKKTLALKPCRGCATNPMDPGSSSRRFESEN